ncbi:phosphoenolpyruvate carboxykinase [GTP], mitochondrial-like [Cyprinus carpio]|uniref:Phosphoenolpyruvate carboxykinase [GTP], mitochondrial-like n=1 Tax=Cyprinus carpio TaxID=7962 RepID=A0A9Q9ZX89_CYPCA|nr:phosphoenolpyruvate carboxykinase [GTP], mitochondrial-like [Cyprinus carpio]
MRSESTAAAEHKGKVIMHDPFAMRPFFGYNFGDYLAHWLSMETRKGPTQLPKIFHVNWFRKDQKTALSCGQGLERTPASSSGSSNDAAVPVKRKLPPKKETQELRTYFTQQVGADLPAQVEGELRGLEERWTLHLRNTKPKSSLDAISGIST